MSRATRALRNTATIPMPALSTPSAPPRKRYGPPRPPPGSQLPADILRRLKALGVSKLPAFSIRNADVAVANLDAADAADRFLLKWPAIDKDGHVHMQYAYAAGKLARGADVKWERVRALSPDYDRMRSHLRTAINESAPGSKEHAAAVAAAVIAETALRPGGGAGGRAEHFGVVTMPARSMKITGEIAEIGFVGKEGKINIAHVRDPITVAGLAYYLARRAPDDRLLPTDAASARRAAGSKLKDFRTLIGTREAEALVDSLAPPPPPLPANKKKAAVLVARIALDISKRVASLLNNTPTVARGAYIHPETWTRLAAKVGWLRPGEQVEQNAGDSAMREIFPIPLAFREAWEQVTAEDRRAEKNRAGIPLSGAIFRSALPTDKGPAGAAKVAGQKIRRAFCPPKGQCATRVPAIRTGAPAAGGRQAARHVLVSAKRKYGYTVERIPVEKIVASHLDSGAPDLRARPEDFQARNFNIQRAREIAAELDPELLTPEGQTPTVGAPVVWLDEKTGLYHTLAGNHRLVAMRISGKFGKEIVVRVLQGGLEDARRLAATSQQSEAAAETLVERARATARGTGLSIEDVPQQLGSSPITRDNVHAFLQRNAAFAKKILGGQETTPEDAANRVAQALVGLLPPSTQEVLGAVGLAAEKAIAAAAPAILWLHRAAKGGEVLPVFDVLPAFDRAAQVFRRYSGKGMSAAKIIQDLTFAAEQPGLFGSDVTNEIDRADAGFILGLASLEGRAAPAEAMAEAFGALLAAAKEHNPKQVALFAGANDIEPMDVVRILFGKRIVEQAGKFRPAKGVATATRNPRPAFKVGDRATLTRSLRPFYLGQAVKVLEVRKSGRGKDAEMRYRVAGAGKEGWTYEADLDPIGLFAENPRRMRKKTHAEYMKGLDEAGERAAEKLAVMDEPAPEPLPPCCGKTCRLAKHPRCRCKCHGLTHGGRPCREAQKNPPKTGLERTYTISVDQIPGHVVGRREAIAGARRVHGHAPRTCRVYEYNDGRPEMTEHALYSLGEAQVRINVVEGEDGRPVRIKDLDIGTVYAVKPNSRSVKAGRQFIHSHRDECGTPPLQAFDPIRKLLIPVGGTYDVKGKWIRR